ncbi:MAG: winged helix-turn-helix domain-containing protein [Chloroflexi bacterium]|nr:winged helix-turn-helix domain-containing protein [Chloroflexota bacterium]
MPDWFEDGNLRVDYRGCRVWVDGELVHLSALRFRILQYLTENAGKSLSPRDILRNAWMDEQYDVGLVRWHIARLRRDLNDSAHQRIVHVRGFGYRYDRVTPEKPPVFANGVTPTRRGRLVGASGGEPIHRCSPRPRAQARQSRLRPVMAT